MESFLKLAGNVTVEWIVIAIAAVIFLIKVYGKIEKYFSEKAITEKEKNDRIQEVIDQAEKYPKWHQQSIAIRDGLNQAINDLGGKLDTANKALEELKKENGENKASTCRYRILRFDDEIRHNEKHTKEHFDQILEDITEYERYCETHPAYENNKAVMAICNIKRIYQQCESEGTFL